MDVQQLINALGQLAEKNAEARAFLLVFVGELILLVGFTAYFLQRLVNRRRVAEADEDVPNPNAELASAMSRVSDALLVFANSFTPILKDIQTTTQNTEAGVAGLAGDAKRRAPVDTALLESLDVVAQAQERLQKSIAAIRTKEDATAMDSKLRDDVKTDTLLAVQPLVARLDAHSEAINAVPPRLDALKVKLDELPPIIIQSFNALVAERDEARKTAAAEREQKEQAQSALATFQRQNADLTGQLMAKDTTIADRERELHDLREMLAQMKLAATEGNTAAATTLVPPAVAPDVPAVAL